MVSEEAGKVTHAKDYEFVLPSGRKLSGLIVKSEKNKSTLTLLVHGWLDNSGEAKRKPCELVLPYKMCLLRNYLNGSLPSSQHPSPISSRHWAAKLEQQ